MKIEVENKEQERTEQHALKQIEKWTVFIGSAMLTPGHRVFQINLDTLDVVEASYETTVHFDKPNTRNIIVKENHQYVMALNKKNALKRFKRGF